MNKKLLIITVIAVFGFSKNAKADFVLGGTQNTACDVPFQILDASFNLILSSTISFWTGPPTCYVTPLTPAYVRFQDPCTLTWQTITLNSFIMSGCPLGDPCDYVRNVSYAASSGCGGYIMQLNL